MAVTMGLRAASRFLRPLASLQHHKTSLHLSRVLSSNSERKLFDELVCNEDPDSFGLTSRTNKIFTQKYEMDEDDLKEEKYLSEIPLRSARLSTKKYADLIKEHLENKRIKEALDVLEIKMLQEDRAKPENYIYNLLIDGCATVGYTKKAFQLFNNMKKRSLQVTGATYTSLFNACSNSPWIEDGLTRAKKLRELMIDKGHEPNLTNYNSMIKAFGRCGDLLTAFQIVDEMNEKRIKIRVHTYNFLLQSCISDKTSGFRHALLTWRKMLANRERPNIYSFNLMLKCIRECSIGDSNLENDIERILPNISNDVTKRLISNDISEKHGKNREISSNTSEVMKNEPCNVLSTTNLPNLLSIKPNMGNVISLSNIKTAEDRFMLVGGMDTIFNELRKWNIDPDIKTFTQMLQVIPNTLEAEERLMEQFSEFKVKTDIDFYNMLIKKRCYRFDYESARDVKLLIGKENQIRDRGRFTRKKNLILPDIVTYGVLGLCCNTKETAQELVEEIKNRRIKLNAEILGTLLQHGKIHLDFDYIYFIMNTVKEENISVNTKFLQHLDGIKSRCHKILKEKEVPTNNAEDPHKKFLSDYKKWKIEMKINDTEETAHPWTQFRVNQPTTFQRPKITPKPIQSHKRERRNYPKYVVRT